MSASVHTLAIAHFAVRSLDPDVGLGRALSDATWPVTPLVPLNTPAARGYFGRGRGARQPAVWNERLEKPNM
ncbi:hypothetical protein ACQP2P_29745 [Dactylosporangium sp. CA-139114]|uniref:hypothetical protein n=1 Tax=Dactylosporangium sp. CA-139114 TaxID=3239931 RepID=UPI003D99B411